MNQMIEKVAAAIASVLNTDDLPDGGWPQITRQAARAAICGTNPSAIPADMVGCGEPFASFADAYRCTHCDVLFHKPCAEKHFSSDNVLTEEMVDEIERRSALSPLPQGED